MKSLRSIPGRLVVAFKRNRSEILLFCAVVFAYLYFFPYFSQLNSPAENSRIYMVKAIVDHGTFAVDPVLREGNPYVVDLARYEGKLYSAKAPGTSFLGVPFYFVARQFGDLSMLATTYLLRLFVSILPSLIFLAFFYRFLGRFTGKKTLRDLVFVGVALGSMGFTYGILLFGHQQAAMGLFGGFMLFYTNHKRERDSAALLIPGGFLVAFAVSCEYQVIVSAALLGAYGLFGLKRKWKLVYILLGSLVPVGLTMLYHQQCYGSVMSTGHHHLAHQAFVDYQQHGWRGLFYFSWQGLFGTFVSPANGLFFFSPWLVFWLPGVWFAFRRRGFVPEALCILAVPLVLFVIISSMAAWKAGWTVGPRYLCACLPFLALGVLVFLDSTRARFQWLYYLFVPCLLASVAIYSLSSPVFPHFPEGQFNPLFDFLLPLVQQGHFPRNLGRAVGLGDWGSFVPYLLVVGGAAMGVVFFGFGRDEACRPRLRPIWLSGLVALVCATGLLWLLSLPDTKDPVGARGDLAFVERIWEPPRIKSPVDP